MLEFRKNKDIFRLFFTSIFLQTFVLSYSKPSHIWLQNGYRDIVVSLPEDALKSERPSIVRAVQDLFRYSSRVLYVATKRRATFAKVIILIPSSWGPPQSWLPEEEDTDNTVLESNGGFPSIHDADVVFTEDMGERKKPYVLQDDGCGIPGVRINVPIKFLTSDSDIRTRSIEFIHYWSQFRYGVFAEGGFLNDSRYPQYYSIPGTKEIQVTACSSVPLSYNFTSIPDDQPCEPHTDEQTGKPVFTECKPMSFTENELLTSSLMYQQALPHTFHFCEADQSLDRKHNPVSPSKHNVLCSQEGVWHVILRSKDFSLGKNPATRYKPENVSFQFVQESKARVVIAVDVSSSMIKNDRYSLVKNALVKFILFDLPLGADLGMIFFANDVKSVHEMLSLSTEEAKRQFLESAPFYEEPDSDSDDVCLTCAIDWSLQLLKNASNGLENGLIILISSNGSIIESADNKDLNKKLKNDLIFDGTKLFTLLISNDTDSENKFLETLISKGSLTQIPESNKVQTLFYLYLALHSTIARISTSSNEEQILLIREVSSTATESIFHFDVDSSATKDLKLFLTGPDFQILRPTLDVSNTYLTGPSSEQAVLQKENFIPAWLYRFRSAEIGNYTFHMKRKPGMSGDYLIIVTGRPASNKTPSIDLKSWINHPNAVISGPLKIFAEIKYGNRPIINVKVKVLVRGPDGVDVSTFELLDNGLGDPDITKDDGIYSRYCAINTYTLNGYYTITVYAFGEESGVLYISDNYCCGSFIPSLNTGRIEPFSRMRGPLTFRLSGSFTQRDSAPPNRVLDLRVYELYQETRTVVLHWTSAGQQFDRYAATSYHLKLFRDRTSARRRFEETGLSLSYGREITHYTDPQMYGNLVEYTVQWPETLPTAFYFFALKAIDDFSDTSGEVSNVVEIYLENTSYNDTILCDDEETDGAPNLRKESFLIALSLILSMYLSPYIQ